MSNRPVFHRDRPTDEYTSDRDPVVREEPCKLNWGMEAVAIDGGYSRRRTGTGRTRLPVAASIGRATGAEMLAGTNHKRFTAATAPAIGCAR